MEILLFVGLRVNKYRPVKSRAIEVTTSLLEKVRARHGRQHSGLHRFACYTATPIGSAANTNAD